MDAVIYGQSEKQGSGSFEDASLGKMKDAAKQRGPVELSGVTEMVPYLRCPRR